MTEEKVKRKAYSTPEAQAAATRRYLNPADPELKKERQKKRQRSVLKSSGKKFILEHATLEELKEFKSYISKRENILKKNNKNSWHSL